jgi:Bacteroidetes VLRF1 release factor/Vms1-associating treble clef domain
MSDDAHGKILNTLALYSKEAYIILQNSVETTKAYADLTTLQLASSFSAKNYRYSEFSSDDEGEEASSSTSSEDESEEDEETEGQNGGGKEKVKFLTDPSNLFIPSSQNHSAPLPRPIKPKKGEPKRNKQAQERLRHTKQQRENLICLSLPIDDGSYLAMPSSILNKEIIRPGGVSLHVQCQSSLSLCAALGGYGGNTNTSPAKMPVVVLIMRSGRFAGGVFEGERCLVHRALQRYTVRKGQGKAQSSQDNSKRKAKSMGAQLRRHGEQSLKEDIQATLMEWKDYIQRSCLILISCPKTMKATIFSDEIQELVLRRDDERLRKIPFDVGRPSFESVCDAHEVLLTVNVRERKATTTTGSVDTSVVAVEGAAVEEAIGEGENHRAQPQEPTIIPLTSLHEAAEAGNLPLVLDLLCNKESEAEIDINQLAGPDFMTPLHYAAASTANVDPVVAAACVLALLIQGRADPCTFDARSRPPYFLATHDTVREAFRKTRASLGEDTWDWDRAKVGPALTEEDLQERKAKEAEKKRRKKQKQKENKAKEKAQTEALERQRKEEEEQQQQAEDAKRIRDGLQPKTNTATNVCDFCQKVCKGKRRNQMLVRLDYAYCSTDCVQNHKRELMASAALARFG